MDFSSVSCTLAQSTRELCSAEILHLLIIINLHVLCLLQGPHSCRILVSPGFPSCRRTSTLKSSAVKCGVHFCNCILCDRNAFVWVLGCNHAQASSQNFVSVNRILSTERTSQHSSVNVAQKSEEIQCASPRIQSLRLCRCSSQLDSSPVGCFSEKVRCKCHSFRRPRVHFVLVCFRGKTNELNSREWIETERSFVWIDCDSLSPLTNVLQQDCANTRWSLEQTHILLLSAASLART